MSTIEVCSFHAAPWAYESDGEYLGFEPALLKLFLREHLPNATLHFQFVTAEGLVTELIAEKCDITISRLTITQERREMGAEFVPYLTNRVVIVANPNSVPVGEVSFDDLVGLTWGTIRGSSYVTVIRELNDGDQNIKMKFWDEPPMPGEKGDPLINNLLLTGKADVVAVDAALMMSLFDTIPEYSQLRIVGYLTPPSGSEWGVAFRKGDPLVKPFSTFLSSLVQKDDGEAWRKLLVDHLGESLGGLLAESDAGEEDEEDEEE